MPDRISKVNTLRRGLLEGMSAANTKTLRTSVFESQHHIRYFANPMSSLRAALAFSNVTLNERRGLDTLYILAVTAQDPIQLANSMGAIGVTSYINELVRTLDKKPEDLSYISTKYDQSVQSFRKSLTGSPSGSFAAESLTASLRADSLSPQTPGKYGVVTVYTQEVYNPTPDREYLLSMLVEASFLLALDTDAKDPSLKLLKRNTSTDFLTNSSPLFAATERLLASNPEYFDIVFGTKASFWREYRHQLFPDLLDVASKIIEERALIKTWQADPILEKKVGQLYKVAKADLIAQEVRKKVAADPEKYAWFDAKADFEQKWHSFTTDYEKKNGPLNTPPTSSQSVDLLTGGIDILHESIFSDKTNSQLRAGLETIVPKFWPFKDLDFVLTEILSEYDFDHVSGDPILTIHGEKALAQLIFLPKHLRPSKLGSDIKISAEQQKAMSKIHRSLARITHPDIAGSKYPNSHKTSFESVEGFIKIANGLHSLHMK